MTFRADLEQIFTDSKLNNVYINLDNNYCTTSNKNLVFSIDNIGVIYASPQQCIKKIMQDIDAEGSADVCWMYDGINRNNVGCILNQVFRENGYYTVWNGYNKISSVIEKQDLPKEFLKRWNENIKSKNLKLGIYILDLDNYKVDDSGDDSGDVADIESEDETRCLPNYRCINCEIEKNE